jgi:hypothetical protein
MAHAWLQCSIPTAWAMVRPSLQYTNRLSHETYLLQSCIPTPSAMLRPWLQCCTLTAWAMGRFTKRVSVHCYIHTVVYGIVNIKRTAVKNLTLFGRKLGKSKENTRRNIISSASQSLSYHNLVMQLVRQMSGSHRSRIQTILVPANRFNELCVTMILVAWTFWT